MKNVKWVFFDLDGTLADSLSVMYQVYLDFLKEFDVQGSKEEFQDINGPALPEIIALLKSRYELKDSHESLKELYAQKIQDAYRELVLPFGDAEAVLNEVKQMGYQLMLTTAAASTVAKGFIDKNKWSDYFDAYVCGDEVVNAKPDPEIYTRALEKAEIESDHAVIVEDSVNGVLAAKAASVYTIGVAADRSVDELKDAKADMVVTSLSEVVSLFQKVGQ